MSGKYLIGVGNFNPSADLTDFLNMTSRGSRKGGVLQNFEGIMVKVAYSNGIFLRNFSVNNVVSSPPFSIIAVYPSGFVF